MTLRDRQPRLLWSLLTTLCFCSGHLAAQHCGVERWSIKTGTDSGAAAVNLSAATPTTISALVGVAAPQPIPVDSRVIPTETTVWQIDATLTSFKLEGDSDYHLVIADASGNTMIAEIPLPACVNGGSPFNPSIARARAQFDAAFTVGPNFQDVNVPVRVTGVGMFDFLHGQRGVAPNGIELHPVIDIVFNPGLDFSLGVSQASLSLPPGSSGTLSVAVAASGAFTSAVSLSAAGTPPGISVSFAPDPVVPGSSAVATVAVDASTPPGSYTVTVTGSGGALNHTATFTVIVAAANTADFALAASPASVAVGVGGSNSATLSLQPAAGFSGDVALSVSGLPVGVSASLSNTTLSGAGSSVLTITAATSTAAGPVPVTVVASSGALTHSAVLSVTICGGVSAATTMREGLAGTMPPRTVPVPEPDLTTARNDDDSQVQILPTASAIARARQHGDAEICNPRQYAVFLGRGWADPANLSREKRLEQVRVAVKAPAICGTGKSGKVRLEVRALAGAVTLSDLDIQAQLDALLRSGTLAPPTRDTLYVIYLAPEVRSTLGAVAGGEDYLAFENHFHASQGEIRYIVVPFDTDLDREVRTATRALLRAMIAAL